MANPNYPPMGGPPMGGPPMGGPPMGPPMGGPPMGGPPMGGPMHMQRPMRRGTSKAVPVVVSAGLAVGVFCGLLFGVGTGKDEAHAAAPSGNNVKAEPEPPKPDPGAAPAGLGATSVVKAPPPAAGSGSAAPTVAQGSAAGSAAPAAGSAAPVAGSAAPTVVEAKKIKVTFTLKPEAAMKDAKFIVDGNELEGNVAEFPAGTKSIKVEVKAPGYHSFSKKQDLIGEDLSIEYEIKKRSSGSNIHPPKRPERPPSGGGGLIDI